MGIKLYRLALDLDRGSDELLQCAEELGLSVKSHLETLEVDEAQSLCESLGYENAEHLWSSGEYEAADDVELEESDESDESAAEESDEQPAEEPEVEEDAAEPEVEQEEEPVEAPAEEPEAPAEEPEAPAEEPEAPAEEPEAEEPAPEETPAEAETSAAEPVSEEDGIPNAEDLPSRAKSAAGEFLDRKEVKVVEENPAHALMRAQGGGATTTRRSKLDERQKELLAARLEALRKESLGLGAGAAAAALKKKGQTDRRETQRGAGRRGTRGRRQAAADARARIRSARQTTAARKAAIEISLPITIKDLSQAIGVSAGKIIKYLMVETGSMVTMNAHVERDLVEMITLEFEVEVELKEIKAAESHINELVAYIEEQVGLNPQPRPPVVAILGHVDHGKTSILDQIRNTNVQAGEAGGITQNLSAWQVKLDSGRELTFIDTPGHAAFTAMRARGARHTDIVVLVVAADDGVMPQTEEAIDHARAAGTPILIALNKIDRPNANPEQALQQLANLGLQAEEWGGETQVVRTSGLTGEGIPELLEAIDLAAEIEELSANPEMRAFGVVLEGKKDEGVGNVATLLIQGGSLNRGDAVLAGLAHGKVRAMARGFGKSKLRVDRAGPSTPVEVTGLSDVPEAGDSFFVLDTPAQAKEIAEERQRIAHEAALASRDTVTIDGLFGLEEAHKQRNVEQVQLLVKADVRGSVEVLKGALAKLDTDEVKLKLVRAAIGGVNESDVLLADASNAMILAFNVAAESRARTTAEAKKVPIRSYRVIYELLDDVKKAMEGLLAPDLVEEYQGTVLIKKLFKSSRHGMIAGCQVEKGTINRNQKFKLVREGVILNAKLELDSLKRFKDDVREVKEGFECGLTLRGFGDIKEGDILEAYTINEVARTLD